MRIPPDHRLDASPQLGLFEMLAAATRRRSDGMLATGTSLGIVVAAAAVLASSPWRPLALAGLAASAFGGWGILDRTVAEHRAAGGTHATDGALRVAALALLAAGWLALGTFLFLGFGHVLDGVIH